MLVRVGNPRVVPRPLRALPRAIDARIDDRVYAVLTVDASVASRRSHGGTAPDQVRARIAQAKEELG